jgi:IclR family KDG regulon transcriptional repressor
MDKTAKSRMVNKALDILQIFLDCKGEVSLADLANLSGLNIGTVYRITSVLREKGYIIRGNKRGKFLIGPKFLEFGNVVRGALKIEDIARPYMQNLQHLTDESVHISRPAGDKFSYIEIIHSSQVLRVVPVSGVKLPLHCTAAGKVFLAHLGKDKLERFFNKVKRLEPYTDNSITDVAELKKQLNIIRNEGVALDKEEFVLGITDIAAPIFSSDGKLIACLGIYVPSVRATKEKIKSLVPMIKKCSLEISQAIGFRAET